jgi:haloacetate dehalogenase
MLFDERFEAARFRTTDDTEIHLRHAGHGPPLLFLHGYPQTHAMWHEVAPAFCERFHVVCADLRGYGDSSKPAGSADHASYAKRTMATDMIDVMQQLGFGQFAVAGHDRGGRVAHRMALDHPERVSKLCVMDIAPTLHMYEQTDQHFATGYYHWFFLIQPDGLPERLIGADPDYFLDYTLEHWSARRNAFDPDAVAEYRRCFRDPRTIHASCEDYRAAATIDLEHDRSTLEQRIDCPLLVLWGEHGFVNRLYDVPEAWRPRARTLEGKAIDSGHFLPEEAPDEVTAALLEFLERP